MKYYTYNWLHIPTGRTGTTTVSEYYLMELRYRSIYEALNSWNQAGAGRWQYWISAVNALGVPS